MSITKKGSRKITINNEDYRWLIRRKATYEQWAYEESMLHVAIERAIKPSSVLHIVTDKRHPQNISNKEISTITPKDISIWIIEALNLGWNTNENGGPFHVKIEKGKMRHILL